MSADKWDSVVGYVCLIIGVVLVYFYFGGW